jgi:tetratricopeptide (TPR) repeat protein
MASFTEACRVDPESAQARFNRGQLMMQLGNYDEAEKELTAVVNLAPHDPEAYLLRAKT